VTESGTAVAAVVDEVTAAVNVPRFVAEGVDVVDDELDELDAAEPPNNVIISSGSGNLASEAVPPYRILSRFANPAASTLVESTVINDVGCNPGTGIGFVVIVQLKAIAAGESLIVA